MIYRKSGRCGSLDFVGVVADVASSQGGFGWDDAASIGMSTAGATGGGLHNIMIDRGKYMPRNAKTLTGKSYSIKKTGDIVLRSRLSI